MRRIALTIFLAAASLSLSAQQRDYVAEIASDPNRAGTVYYMYNHDVPDPAVAPKGFKPLYISHYGRHGARNHSSEPDYTMITSLLEKAKSQGVLTDMGERLYDSWAQAYPELKGRSSDLTGAGAEQQYRIAHNMFNRYPKVFKGDARIDAISTQVPRVILTMDAFCDQLLIENPHLQIRQRASKADVNIVNPFTIANPDETSTDTDYVNKNAYWADGFKQQLREKLEPEKFFSKYFTDLSVLNGYGDPYDIEFAFYGSLANTQCNELVRDDMMQYLTHEERCRLYDAVNWRFYCSKGPDTLWQKGRQWAFAWRTVQDFVDKADEDLASGEYSARLRFGHDIIMMSVLALLDVDGYNKPVGDLNDISKYWESYDFPMSLNLQLVFYRNKAGEVLVRAAYNERDIEFPIENCGTKYYYRWDDFRTYALSRIEVAKHILATTQAPPKRK